MQLLEDELLESQLLEYDFPRIASSSNGQFLESVLLESNYHTQDNAVIVILLQRPHPYCIYRI
jgi:hypothetical protein